MAGRPGIGARAIRAAELRSWSAELMRPGIAGLFLHGMAGIGKSVLAAYIADRIGAEYPQTLVTTITGALTVERLAAILVADRPSLVVLDQFETNITDGMITDRGLAAVLVCLAEEIAGRDDDERQARVIVTARQPVTLGPRILVRHVGPLTLWSANEFARSLPRLARLTDAEREYAWQLTAGHPGCMRTLDARLADATFAEIADRLAREVAFPAGRPASRVYPTELDASTAAALASAVEAALSRPASAPPVDAFPGTRPGQPDQAAWPDLRDRPVRADRPDRADRLDRADRPAWVARATRDDRDGHDEQGGHDERAGCDEQGGHDERAGCDEQAGRDDGATPYPRLRVVAAALVTAAVACSPFAIRPLIAVTGSAAVASPASIRAAASARADGAWPLTAGAVAVPAAIARTATSPTVILRPTIRTETETGPATLTGPATRSGPATARPGQPARDDQAAEDTGATAAIWLAANVTRGTVIGCDPAMCAGLARQGLPQADLRQLRPGTDLTADGLIVATPQARTLMGGAIEAAAPELAASFGAGSTRVDIWEVTPGGTAAYRAWRLAADLTSRRNGGNLILGNPSIGHSGDTRAILAAGHVDSRILLALAEMAHSASLRIDSFGAASPGAAPEVPVRSVQIDVANPAAAATYLRVQDPVMQPLAVRIGHASLWVEYGVPSPLGLFQARS